MLRRHLGIDGNDDEGAGGPWHPKYRDAADERKGDGALRFIRDVLGLQHPRGDKVQMWSFQRALVRAVYEHRRVAVTSSRSTGKTHALGHLAAAFFFQEPSRVLVVTPTMRQAQKGVLGEMRAAIARATSTLALDVNNQAELRIDERHWCIALPSRDPDAMRGFHASPPVPSDPDADFLSDEDKAWLEEQASDESTRLLVIIDEAAGVGGEAFRVLSGMLTKSNVFFVLTGNPTLGADDEHDYVRAFREGSPWHRIRVSSVDPSDFPPPSGIEYDHTYHPIPQYLVRSEDIRSALAQYDRSDPILIADWAGTFPTGATEFNVVPRTALEAALGTRYDNTRGLGPRIGVDIGTGNPDMSVASLFVDGVKRAQHKWAPATDDREGQVSIAATIQALAAKWGAQVEQEGVWDGSPIPGERISIDDSGLVGVGDILASRGLYVDRANFAKGAEGQWRDLVGTQRFTNLRTEMHWVARRGLQEGVFVIPREFTESWDQATWTQFERTYDAKGAVIKLEPKEAVKKRHGGRSPDVWDADILAMGNPSTVGTMRQEGPKVLGRAGFAKPQATRGHGFRKIL